MKISISSFKRYISGLHIFWLFLALLLLIEGVLRFNYFGINAVISPGNYLPRPITKTPFIIPDQYTEYRLRPNASGYFKGKLLTTNSWGWRGKEVNLEKTDGTLRIAVLGASITMGSGVADDETSSYHLERMLSSELGRKVEVINMAVGAHKAYQMRRQFEVYGRQFNPDVVLLSVPPAKLPVRYWRTRTIQWEPLLAYPIYRLLNENSFLAVALNGAYRSMVKGISQGSDWKERGMESVENSYSMVDALRDLAAGLTDTGVPVVLNTFRWQGRYYPYNHKHRAYARELARQTNNLYLIDTYDDLGREYTGADQIYAGDTHPNPAMHRIYAEHISKKLIPLLRRLEII